MEIRISPPLDEGGDHYIFTDLAGFFWPDFWEDGGDNHDAEEKVRARLDEQGCERVPLRYSYGYRTPGGVVGFDSEAGCFECHGPKSAVEYVRNIIESELADRAAHRKALS